MELLYFVLAAFGLTGILVYGKIFDRIRPKRPMFHCCQCMGFHVGWFLMLLSPFTELFSFDVSVVNALLLGGLSSGTSYVLNMIFGDEGIKYEHRHLDEK